MKLSGIWERVGRVVRKDVCEMGKGEPGPWRRAEDSLTVLGSKASEPSELLTCLWLLTTEIQLYLLSLAL